MSDNYTLIESKIEEIAAYGCLSVINFLDSFENGDVCPELNNLTDTEKTIVIKELQEIMSVYQN